MYNELIMCDEKMNPVKLPARTGDRLRVKTLSGGILSGERVLVFEVDEKTLVEDLPLGTLIEFDNSVRVMGSYNPGMGRSPDGRLYTRQAIVSVLDNETQRKLRGLDFIGGQRLLFHFIYPGQIFTVLRINQ
jgi:hypothetical protein